MTKAGLILHYVGPKTNLDILWSNSDGTTEVVESFAVCGAWGSEGTPHTDPWPSSCHRCVQLINDCRTGKPYRASSPGGEMKSFRKPYDWEVKSILKHKVPAPQIEQLLNMGLGDRAMEAVVEYGVDPIVAVKRITNDIHRHKTSWNVALRLMMAETDGTEFWELREKYHPAVTLVTV